MADKLSPPALQAPGAMAETSYELPAYDSPGAEPSPAIREPGRTPSKNRAPAESSVEDLGGSSLMAVNLLGRLSKRYEVSLPTYALMQNQSVSALAELVREMMSHVSEEMQRTALVKIQQGRPPLPTLFMVHPIGGEIYFYRDLARYIGGRQPVSAFQAPSLVGDTPPFDDVGKQAASYVEDLLKLQPKGPYLLGGASYGGLVAIEMAGQLLGAGQEVPLVVMVDTPGPGQMPERTEGYAEILDYLLGDELDLDIATMSGLSPENQLDYVLQEARSTDSVGILPPSLGLPMLKTWMAHQDAMHAFSMESYPGRVIFFRPTETMKLHNPKTHLPWIDLVQGGIEIYRVPGNHITMNYAPNVRVIAGHLRRAIASVARFSG